MFKIASKNINKTELRLFLYSFFDIKLYTINVSFFKRVNVNLCRHIFKDINK